MTRAWPRGWPAVIYVAIAGDYTRSDLSADDLIAVCLFNDGGNVGDYVTRGMLSATGSTGGVDYSSISSNFDVTANAASGTLTLTSSSKYFSSNVQYIALTITMT